jgi:hypothetical protein
MSKPVAKERSDLLDVDETDYLHAAEAGNKFCQMVEEAMKHFKHSVEVAMKERVEPAKSVDAKTEIVKTKTDSKAVMSETELIKAGFLIEKRNKSKCRISFHLTDSC